MNRPAEDPVLRKEVLLARSALCRVKIRFHAHALRQGLSWRRAGAAAVGAMGASPARMAVFLLATKGLGPDRMARWLALAGRALALARLAGLILALLRRPPEAAASDDPHDLRNRP